MDRRWETAAVAVLLAILATELLIAVGADGVTIDEMVYIGSGFRHAAAGDYRMNPEQPPLAKLLGAAPLLALSLKQPPPPFDEWSWSFQFVTVANDADRVVFWARFPTVVQTLALALLLWAWARAIAGPVAGLAALALATFDPSLLAHGHLLTTDLPGTLAMVLASVAFWRWTDRPTPWRGLVVGLVLGVAVSTRLTNWLLAPSFLSLGILDLRRRSGEARAAMARAWLVLITGAVVLVPAVLWASYRFRYAPWPGTSVAHVPAAALGLAGRIVALLESWRALPEAYLEGARFVIEHNAGGHPTYLLGRMSTTGWPHYYLVAFLVKSTPGYLLAAALVAVQVWRQRRAVLAGSFEAHCLLPAALTFLAASAGRIQIGERYILAVHPYLILMFATAVPGLLARGRAPLVALVFAAHAVPALLAAPGGYLPYFNFLAGGREGGHRVLVDSNLDWGQDLPRLAAWMKEKKIDRVQLAYHGSDNPDRYGFAHEDLPGFHLYYAFAHAPERPFTGTVAVSPNILLGLFYGEGANPYQALLDRGPDDRAGVYFVYHLGNGITPAPVR